MCFLSVIFVVGVAVKTFLQTGGFIRWRQFIANHLTICVFFFYFLYKHWFLVSRFFLFCFSVFYRFALDIFADSRTEKIKKNITEPPHKHVFRLLQILLLSAMRRISSSSVLPLLPFLYFKCDILCRQHHHRNYIEKYPCAFYPYVSRSTIL